MGKQGLFSIGEVAKLFHMSASSLRHYERLGLLSPEFVDPASGYRYYSVRQFEALNSIRYLRVLGVPLDEIADFLENREVDRIEGKLLDQKKVVAAKREELKRVERKIDNRLAVIRDARSSLLDEVRLVLKGPCRMVWMESPLKVASFLDMEEPMRKLERGQSEPVVFLGKVGIGISAENLRRGCFDAYDGMFLLLDDEDCYSGEVIELPEALCVSVRFRGGHAEAPSRYEALLSFVGEEGLDVVGFSREVTLIDCAFTNDEEKFVTEISIPVA